MSESSIHYKGFLQLSKHQIDIHMCNWALTAHIFSSSVHIFFHFPSAKELRHFIINLNLKILL